MKRPNQKETQFLNLAYNRFYDLFDEVISDDFWKKAGQYRYSKVRDGFGVYTELLNYEPFVWVIESLRNNRPPMESEIGSELFGFIRNVLIHFPFFNSWNDVWINKSLANWYREGQSIDTFLSKYAGQQEVKYRFWEEDKKRMTYLSINFPNKYSEERIYLKEILSEKEGVKFAFFLMEKILNTQVEEVKDST